MENTFLKISLRNSDIVSGKAHLQNVKIKMDYAEFSVPLKDIAELEFGVVEDISIQPVVELLFFQLGESSKKNCMEAFEQLIELKMSALPVLSKCIDKNIDFEPTFPEYTPELALGELLIKYDLTAESLLEKDVLVLNTGYKLPGVCSMDDIELKTAFGTLKINRENIKNVQISCIDENQKNIQKTFKILANKHISCNPDKSAWLNTGIKISKGQQIQIQGKGEIILASLNNEKYIPSGAGWTSSGQPINQSPDPKLLNLGGLVFKIGETGQPTSCGQKYSGKSQQSGMLYLSIYETVYNSANSGFYTAQITVH